MAIGAKPVAGPGLYLPGVDPAHVASHLSFGHKADRGMTIVAKRLIGGMTASAKSRRGQAIDRATGAGTDFDRSANVERAIRLGTDIELAAADREGFGWPRFRLAGGNERDVVMAAVAKRFPF